MNAHQASHQFSPIASLSIPPLLRSHSNFLEITFSRALFILLIYLRNRSNYSLVLKPFGVCLLPLGVPSESFFLFFTKRFSGPFSRMLHLRWFQFLSTTYISEVVHFHQAVIHRLSFVLLYFHSEKSLSPLLVVLTQFILSFYVRAFVSQPPFPF